MYAAGNLRPPEVNSPRNANNVTDHDVVEVSYYKVGLCEMDIQPSDARNARQASDREQPDKSASVRHRRFKRDGALAQSRGVVEDLPPLAHPSLRFWKDCRRSGSNSARNMLLERTTSPPSGLFGAR